MNYIMVDALERRKNQSKILTVRIQQSTSSLREIHVDNARKMYFEAHIKRARININGSRRATVQRKPRGGYTIK